MRVSAEFDKTQLAALLTVIEERKRRALDLRPALLAIADDFRGLEQGVLASRDHGSWPPISPAWRERKLKRGASGADMVYSGTLLRSLTEPHARYSARRITKDSVTMGTRDPVARLHQRGAAGPGRRVLPARRVVRVDALHRQRWLRMLEVYLTATRSMGM